MTCKEVSTLMAAGDLKNAPAMRRLAAWAHLAMCRHCRAFRRQLEVVTAAARAAAEALQAEPSQDFESKIVDRIRQ